MAFDIEAGDPSDLALDLSAPIAVEREAKPLRPHQQRAHDAIMGHYADVRRVIACGPTGCGKSRLGRAVAEHFSAPLCLTHTRPLFEQNAREICRTLMIQRITMAAAEGQLDSLLDAVGDVDLVIEDEAHHLASGGWKIVHEIGRWKTIKRLGLTATPARGDGKPLRPYYDGLVKIADYSELIAAGYLVPARLVKAKGAQTRIGRSVRMNAAQGYLEYNGLRAIIFCEDVEHSRVTVGELKAAGVRAAHIDGDTPERTRRDLFAQYTAGDLDVLSNCDVLTEGVDLPCTELVLLAKSYCTHGAYLQAAGRGLRASPATGKTELVLVDLAGASIDFGSPDDDIEYKLDGKAIELQPGKVWVCGVCYRNFSPKIAGETEDSWRDRKGLLVKRELTEQDLAKRNEWCAKRGALWAEKASAEYISERQRKQRVKSLNDYTKGLRMQLGAIVQVCSVPAESSLLIPCPHCLRERPRGNVRTELEEVQHNRGPGAFSLTPPAAPKNVGDLIASLSRMFDAAMSRKQCLTSVAAEYRQRHGVEIPKGYARKADELATGKYRKYQDEYLDGMIVRRGWKPGVKFIRLTKFFGR